MKAMKSGAAYTGFKASHRSAGTEDESAEGESLIRVAPYQAVGKINHRINTVFSKEEPQDIMDFIGVYAGKNCNQFDFAKNKPKVTMKFLLENEEPVEIKARLTQVDESKLYALEFSRMSGDHHDYMNKLEELIEAMGDIACEGI